MNSNFLFNRFFQIALFLCTMSYGQNPMEFDATRIQNALSGGNPLVYAIEDANSSDVKFENPMTFVALKIKDQVSPIPVWYTLSLRLEIAPGLADGTFDTSNATQVTLKVENNTLQGSVGLFADLNKHILSNTFGASVKVLESRFKDANSNAEVIINGTIPDDIVLTIGFDADRFDRMDPLRSPVLTILPINEQNELPISWTSIKGATYYDLEWTWVDSFGDTFDIDAPPTAIQFSTRDFELNNTRVQIENTAYSIPIIYEKGYLIFRVRPVGRFLENTTKNQFGRWSTGIADKQTVADWGDAVFKIASAKAHERNKNWQFQASYAEEGKKKEVVSYFDGTLRNRQTVTKINSDNHAIVGEVIYDAQGRPAVEVLPVPTNDNEIKFYKDFNKSARTQDETGSNPYTYKDFDLDTQNELDVPSSDKMMDPTSGAAKYYSSNNDVNDSFKDRVADAEQYPFSQIEYTPDNTGRIQRKSGVGQTHQLGTKHEMEYYYGTPEQKELNRLFGYSVGKANHYKKNLVLDPNQQASVSYIDPQGRTIATALMGYSPQNLLGLDDEIDEDGLLHKIVTTDLLNKIAPNDKDTDFDFNVAGATGSYGTLIDQLTFNTSKISAFEEVRAFSYSLANATYFNPDCGQDENYPLVYDIEFDVLDKNANSLLKTPIKETIDLSQTGNNPYTIENLQVPVPRGSYSITKNVVVNQEALDKYVDQYVASLTDEDSPCYIPPTDIEFLPPSEFDGCFKTCEECEEALLDGRTKEAAIAQYAQERVTHFDFSDLSHLNTTDLQGEKDKLYDIFAKQYEDLILACKAPCLETGETVDGSDSVSCQVLNEQLFSDMKPIGQYGDKSFKLIRQANNTGFVEENVSESNGELSIFNENNKLFSTGLRSSDKKHNSWRNPSYPGRDPKPNLNGSGKNRFKYGHYYNEDGTISYVKVKATRTETIDRFTGEQKITITYEPPILENKKRFLKKGEDTDNYLIEPQYLLNVSDFLSDDIWQDNWAASLVVYHPEYAYLQYAELACQKISSVNGKRMNSDGYDVYLQDIKTYADAKKGPLSSFSAIANQDPYFTGAVAGFSTTQHRNIIIEAAEYQF